MKRFCSILILFYILLLCTACRQPPTDTTASDAVSLPVLTDETSSSQSSSAQLTRPDVQEAEDTEPSSTTTSVDIDLTELSSTMVFAEVSNMMMQPDDYLGKTIRMRGIFTTYQDPQTGQVYCGVLVQDATACCAQGFDIVMPQEARYPEDYPADTSEITVRGTLLANEELKKSGIVLLRLEDIAFE